MLKEWIESAKALYRMYRTLATHKINRTDDSEEYKLVLSLLEDGIKFEHQKITALTFTTETITQMYKEISQYCDLVTKTIDPNTYLDNEEYLAISRIFNIVQSIEKELYKVELPIKATNPTDLITKMYKFDEYKNMKIDEFYLSHLTVNIIYILSLAEKSNLNDKTRSFIIRLMYYSIFLMPPYEENFKVTKTIAKPIAMTDYTTELDFLDKDTSDLFIEETLISLTKKAVDNVLKLNDSDLNNEETYFIYVKDMAEILARLISLKNKNRIDEIIDYLETQTKELDMAKKMRIINEIKYMIDYAKKMLEKRVKERNLIYGSPLKETN